MLPHTTSEEYVAPTARKVFVNPNLIATTHLGNNEAFMIQQLPLLLYQQQQQQQSLQGLYPPGLTTTPSIHINPYFLQRKLFEQEQRSFHMQIQEANALSIQLEASKTPAHTAKIISKSSTKLVRTLAPPKVDRQNRTVTVKTPALLPKPPPLISLSKRKLVRQSTAKPLVVASSVISAPSNKYKIDRRVSAATVNPTQLIKKRGKYTFVARYALDRVSQHMFDNKLSTRPMNKISKRSVNNTVQHININGVLYKSTHNKLQRKISTSAYVSSPVNVTSGAKDEPPTRSVCTAVTGRTIFIRGTKFVMDSKGNKLTRQLGHNALSHSNSNSTVAQKRIDIGGLTFIASPKIQNVFVRTSNHVARAHLMLAKQRSMQLLNRSLVKTNIPCAIFQRLGKCIAFARGKCHKLHDKRQVSICGEFLRGECNKSDCLLSHNVSLAKMPVCKFFLQASCIRDDCPYLHKKLSDTAEICMDFLRGYCSLEAKCNKRHEFLCPEFDRKGKCQITNCVHCVQMRNQIRRTASKRKNRSENKTVETKTELVPFMPTSTSITKAAEPINRYFNANIISDENITQVDSDDKIETVLEDSEASTGTSTANEEPPVKYKVREKLGKLPSYIPLL